MSLIQENKETIKKINNIENITNSNNENKHDLPMAWFKFFTKWRPWLSLAITLLIFINYEIYMPYYFSSVWRMLVLILLIIENILSINLFYKVKNRDSDTIDYIKGYLWFEIANMSYGALFSNENIYYNITGIAIILIIYIVLLYFTWYKCNVKYFSKRSYYFRNKDRDINNKTDEIDTNKLNNNQNIEKENNKNITKKDVSDKLSNENKVPKNKVKEIFIEPKKDEKIKEKANNNLSDNQNGKNNKKVIDKLNENKYCIKCGNKMKNSWDFCNYCGNKITENINVENLIKQAPDNKSNKEEKDVMKLLDYKKLLDAGAITKEEYNKKKKEFL